MPLTMATPGEDLRLVAINGGQRVRKRLADMGLTPGTTVRVIQANSQGPLILAFKDDVRLALGRGMAHKIAVVKWNAVYRRRETMAKNFTIALTGNPNSVKSTVFNALTGSRQHVGNWPGKTVEKKEGLCKRNGDEIQVVDLPGTYSLTAYSLEEVITRDYILEEEPDVVIDVVDAANLERNLYLAIQLLELGANLVIALNMSDIADARGLRINTQKLSQGLKGTPVVRTVASKGEGVDRLLHAAVRVAGTQ